MADDAIKLFDTRGEQHRQPPKPTCSNWRSEGYGRNLLVGGSQNSRPWRLHPRRPGVNDWFAIFYT
jgi:hypothetical protein